MFKTFKIKVATKSGEELATVHVLAHQRTKAERLAILSVADCYGRKTSDLIAASDIVDYKLNDTSKFNIYVAVSKDD